MSKVFMKVLTVMLVLSILLSSVGTSFAWLAGSNEADTGVNSYVLTQYFESGRGTYDDPFIIHSPRHLYNLAWLQYLGMFNAPESATSTDIKQYYFELCDGDNDWSSIHGDSGIAGGVLDMDGWTLPPIGTSKNPFVGNFEGNGITISNLTISSTYSHLTDVADKETNFAETAYTPENGTCDIVGLFGVIGSVNEADGTLTKNGNEYTYSSSVNEVKNLNVQSITVETETATSLIGIVAGYVNGIVSGVGVIDSKVVSTSTGNLSTDDFTVNVSDFSTIGFCEDKFKGQLDVVTVDIAEPDVTVYSTTSQSESGSHWGGSIDMHAMYDRMDYMRGEAEEITALRVISEKTITYEDGRPDVQEIQTETLYNVDTNHKNYYNREAGSVTFYYGDSAYNYLFSGKKVGDYTKAIIMSVYGPVEVGAYFISDGNHYLNISTETDIELSDENVPLYKWGFTDGSGTVLDGTVGYLRVFVDDVPYYLNRSGMNLVISSTPTTQWTCDGGTTEGGPVYCEENNVKYYLGHDGNQWTITSSFREGFVITDNNGNYLTNNGTTGVTNTTSSDNAAIWSISSRDGEECYITTVIGNTTYYLYSNNGTLTLSNTYRHRSGGLFSAYIYHTLLCYVSSTDPTKYIIQDENDNCLTYDSGWKLDSGSEGYSISANGRYLAVRNNNGTWQLYGNTADTTVWQFDSDEKVYTTVIVDGTPINYYLTYNGNNNATPTLTQTANNARAWYISGNALRSRYNTNHRLRILSNGNLSVGSNGNDRATVNAAPLSVYYMPKENTNVAVLVIQQTSEEVDQETIKSTTYETYPIYTPYTYFPILANTEQNGYAVIDDNTGYIISGTQVGDKGDIRVSRYAINNRISGSYNGTDLTTVYSVNADGRYTINQNSHSFAKYDESKAQFLEVLRGQSNVYGMHFMNAQISADRIITADYVNINGTTATDYPLPEDCIDCNLVERGYINFFAGTYFNVGSSDENDSFFSLHQITRSQSDNSIVSIKQIKLIYGDPSDATKPYIYRYSDGTWSSGSGTPASPYQLLMNMDWVEYPGSGNWTNNRLYYFEIPVNAGEYALGSVAGHNGAYLDYLDISTTAKLIHVDVTTETVTTTTETYNYPKGVQVIESASSAFVEENGNTVRRIDDKDSAAVAIKGSTGTGGMIISRSGDDITVTDIGSDKQSGSFVAETVTLKNTSDDFLTVSPITKVQKIVQTVTENKYNTAYRTTTTKVTVTTVIIENDVETSRTVSVDGGTPESSSDTMPLTIGDTIISYRYWYDRTDPAPAISNSYAHKALIVPDEEFPGHDGGAITGSDGKPIKKALTVHTIPYYFSPYEITVTSPIDLVVIPKQIDSDFSFEINDETPVVGTGIVVHGS